MRQPRERDAAPAGQSSPLVGVGDDRKRPGQQRDSLLVGVAFERPFRGALGEVDGAVAVLGPSGLQQMQRDQAELRPRLQAMYVFQRRRGAPVQVGAARPPDPAVDGACAKW